MEQQYDEQQYDIQAEPYILSVTGTRLVQVWEDELREDADRLHYLLLKFGMVLHRQPVLDVTCQKKWTFKRVTQREVEYAIDPKEGSTIPTLVKKLYHEEPWTPLQEAQAVDKLRVHLHKLRKNAIVFKRYDDHGKERWHLCPK